MDLIEQKLANLKKQHRELATELDEQIHFINQLRMDLQKAVERAGCGLNAQLNHPPCPPTSHYWNTFGEYWHSFALFTERLNTTYQQLSIPFELEDALLKSPELESVSQWEDVVDDMEDALDSLKLGKASRSYLISVLELVDGVERLMVLRLPKASGKGAELRNTLSKIRRKDICNHLSKVLKQYDVSRIDLSKGQYPPPDTTRIIARTDNNTDDNVIISEIVTHGYNWREQLLRKADVIVESSTGV